MFEMGVTVQVLKRGTMFAMRGSKLYELYRKCGSIDEIPAEEREKLEKQTFRKPLEEIWNETRAFFEQRDPRQIERAERDPKHKMALVFRWYLGQSSNWANKGVEDRAMDYQVWCGPAMGAFNEWARGSHLESWEHRHVDEVNLNIMYGAAVQQRVAALRAQGVAVSAHDLPRGPWTANQLKPYFEASTASEGVNG
jgi:PfaD family protein